MAEIPQNTRPTHRGGSITRAGLLARRRYKTDFHDLFNKRCCSADSFNTIVPSSRHMSATTIK
jgi:hypothetical protein